MATGDPVDPEVDLYARMSLATGIAPNDLLAADPEIFDRMIQLYVEREEARQQKDTRDDLKRRLRKVMGR